MEHISFPIKKRVKYIDRLFGYFARLSASDRFVLKGATLALTVFTLFLFIGASMHSQVQIPTTGGHLTEGIVGTPRFVNPILAVTRADRDLTSLIYDGLVKLGPEGILTPNIAESITVSDDGLTYNVLIRNNIHFHDGAPLTANDVVFTVGRIQEPSLTSPLRANFDGVHVEQLGEYELNFVLPEPYAPFIENLSFGILPQHIWKDASNEEFPFSQLNSEPIGSGPYYVTKIMRNPSGIPESYLLAPYTEYHKGTPRIEDLTLTFFANEEKLVEAFKKGLIDSISGIDQSYLFDLGINTDTHTVITMPLPRTFALFFNQNKSAALRELSARKALSAAIDRTALIDTVLGGYGRPLTSPIPSGFSTADLSEVQTSEEASLDTARGILRTAGWTLNSDTGIWEKTLDGVKTELSFSISTVNSPVFESTAEYLRTTWEKLGVRVTVKQFEQSDLTQSIIRPRDYEALLFGTVLGRSLDFYSFWHSSQRNDPGLNVALYANITTDSILGEMRTSTDTSKREAALTKFAEEINTEMPALFLYTPELLYIFPNSVVGASFAGVAESQERFASIHEWFINTDSVWPIFKN